MATTRADIEAARALMRDFEQAWHVRDFERWGELFTPDADFITWRGVWWKTRAENVAGHRAAPAAVAAQMPNYRLRLEELDCLSGEVALAHASWRWAGFAEAGQAPEDRRGLLTLVLVREARGWRIRALHNTRIGA